MAERRPLTILCLASYFKGPTFIQECKRQGCRVILLTKEKLANAAWPRESIDLVHTMADTTVQPDVTYAASYLARTEAIDHIAGLDEYDIETAAALREHLRIPGMGLSAASRFRDKLAMREAAREHGILVPDFVHVLNYDRVREFMARVPPPWLLKPRFEAAAIGIKKVESAGEFWPLIHGLGDRQSYYILEQFVPGQVFHVDSISREREVLFATAHEYGLPPMTVMHHGGVFTTRSLPPDSDVVKELIELTRGVLTALGHVRGVAHTEFIRGNADGRFYFLETAARVGGAYIDVMVRLASGLDLWTEYARIVLADLRHEGYTLPAARHDYAGLLVCLSRQECPDLTAYDAPEIVWRLADDHHAGLIVVSPDRQRVESLLETYTGRFVTEFLAVVPAPDKPVD